jgi:hypothetical protein
VFTLQARLDGDDNDYDWDDFDFDHDDDNDDDDFIVFGFQDALGALLESGETAIACCPRYFLSPKHS